MFLVVENFVEPSAMFYITNCKHKGLLFVANFIRVDDFLPLVSLFTLFDFADIHIKHRRPIESGRIWRHSGGSYFEPDYH